MTSGCCWRLAWLLGVEADIARLRNALRTADAGDARRVRAMLGELREARVRMREGATLQADLRAVSELSGVVGPEATALALRLRGVPWREVLAGLPDQAATALRDAWVRLCAALSPQAEQGTSRAYGGTAAGPRPKASAPAPGWPRAILQRWIGRTRDGERTLRWVDVFRRAGLLPEGTRAEVIYRHARSLTAACYVLVHLAAPLGGGWRPLARCGLRLLGPAPASV